MANFKKTGDHTFAELCSTFKLFEIPNFQRPYAWKNKQLQDFWSSITENNENYFIGNIVAVDALFPKPLKIIDGQQRLITISLMLCAIRDSYSGLNPTTDKDKLLAEQREEEISEYLIWKDLSPVPRVLHKRLKMGKKMYQDIFDKIVDKKTDDIDINNLGDNEKRIFNSYKILKKLIKKYIENSEISRLDEIKNKVLKLQVIMIVCDTDNDIYGIFEGFNSTGLGLSVADLVKNALLQKSSSDEKEQNIIEDQWNDLEELFEETSISKFPKFLRHQWISENGPVTMSNLYKKIKSEKIEDHSIEDIKNYADALSNDGKIYVSMIYDAKTDLLKLPDSIKKEILEFRYLRNEQVYEVLLSWYKLYGDDKIRESVFESNLLKLWKFIVRTKFVSVNPSDYEKIFSNHCKSLKDAQDTNNEMNSFFNNLNPLVGQKDEFIYNFISDVRYGKDNKLIQRIFKDLMYDDNPEIIQSNPTIEHILPQNPEKWGHSKSDIKDYVNKIGNLTLLFGEYNQENANKTMEEKRKIYAKSAFKLNNEIDSKWGNEFDTNFKSAINKRSNEIAEIIEKVWNFKKLL